MQRAPSYTQSHPAQNTAQHVTDTCRPPPPQNRVCGPLRRQRGAGPDHHGVYRLGQNRHAPAPVPPPQPTESMPCCHAPHTRRPPCEEGLHHKCAASPLHPPRAEPLLAPFSGNPRNQLCPALSHDIPRGRCSRLRFLLLPEQCPSRAPLYRAAMPRVKPAPHSLPLDGAHGHVHGVRARLPTRVLRAHLPRRLRPPPPPA